MESQTGMSFVYWEVVVENANVFVVCMCPTQFIQFAFNNVIFIFIRSDRIEMLVYKIEIMIITIIVRWIYNIDVRVDLFCFGHQM